MYNSCYFIEFYSRFCILGGGWLSILDCVQKVSKEFHIGHCLQLLFLAA